MGADSRVVSKNTQENNEVETRKFTTSTGKTAARKVDVQVHILWAFGQAVNRD